MKAFAIKHPDVDADDIVSIEPAAPGAKATASSSPQQSRQASSASASAIASARPEYNSDYGAARGISSFISGVGWFVVVIGIVTALAGAGQGFALAVLPGLGLAVAGILVVASGQVTRAAVDNADHTREILTLLKKQAAGEVVLRIVTIRSCPPTAGQALHPDFRGPRPSPASKIESGGIFRSRILSYDRASQTFAPSKERTIMIGPQNGYRASIPEISTRYAVDYSRDISLRLLENIEKTVDSLTAMEQALDAVTGAVHTAERSWDDVEALEKMPDDTDQYIDILDKSAELLQKLGEVYLAKKQAARSDRNLEGENEDLVVGSYDRAINQTCNALEAVESLKRTLMDLQALSEPASGSYDSAEELLADLKA